jgi:hypothetical protein
MILAQKVPDFCRICFLFTHDLLDEASEDERPKKESRMKTNKVHFITYLTAHISHNCFSEKSREFLFECQCQEQKPQKGGDNEITACRQTTRWLEPEEGHVMILHRCIVEYISL